LHSGSVMMLLAYVRCVTNNSVLYICVSCDVELLKMLPMSNDKCIFIILGFYFSAKEL